MAVIEAPTPEPSPTMSDRALRAAALSFVELVSRQLLQLALMAILARLLTPADFGVVAVAMVIILVLSALADLGSRTALVQVPVLQPAGIASAYWAVLLFGAALAVVAAWSAPVMEGLFGIQGLAPVLRGLAPVVALNAIAGVSTGLLVRRLRFGVLAWTTVVATASGGVVAIALANHFSGPGPLVAMTVTTAAVTALVATTTARPPLRTKPRADQLLAMLTFGRYVVATMLLDALTTRLPLMVVGGRFGVADAGFYSRAEVMAQASREASDSLVGRVALPLLSRAGEDDASFTAGLRTGIRFGMAIMAPVMLLLAAVATPVTVVLFGPQWESSGPILSALAVGAAVWPVHVVTVNGMFARGHARRVLMMDLRNKALLVLLVLVAAAVGPTAIAWAVTAATFGAALLNMRSVAGIAPYPLTRQVHDGAPMFLAAVPVALVAALIENTWSAPPVVVCLVLIPAGLVVIYASARLARVEVLGDLAERLKAALG